MAVYTSDLETTTDEKDCRVWLWGLCEIGNTDNFAYGTTLDQLFSLLEQEDAPVLYYHNLKFDGGFLLDYLFKNNYRHVLDRKELEDRTFTTLISEQGQFYTMTIMLRKRGHHSQKITIYDSWKILPFSVAAIAKGFGLPFRKLEMDYKKFRPVGYIPTVEEIAYLKHDLMIPAAALKTIFNQGLLKMTAGSNALFDYKQTVTNKSFINWFPVPSYDKDVRQAYKGGFTYLSKRFANIDMGPGIVLDVNSLYPSVMRNRPMPYDEGIHFDGKYKHDPLYPLYVQMVKCNFELKPGHIPTIQLKHNPSFLPTQYLESSDGEDPTLCLTSVDMELFKTHYNIYNPQWLGGWRFKAITGLFTDYVDKWSQVKINAKIEGNAAMYTLAKLMLNSLYGKFSLNPEVTSKIPFYDDGLVRYRFGEKEYRNPVYIPVGAFITAWARYTTITAAQKLYDRFIYADTDSMHLIGTDLPDCIEISDTELGAWKHEGTFRRARYIRQKAYIEDMIISEKEYRKLLEDEKPNVYQEDGQFYHMKTTCSGMPDTCHEFVSWDNFHPGARFGGKLAHKTVKGGIILKDIDFTLKG